MDANEQIKRFVEFFEAEYHSKILENSRKGEAFIVVDFSDLLKHDPHLHP